MYPSFPVENPYWMSGFENTLSQTSEAVWLKPTLFTGKCGLLGITLYPPEAFPETLFQQELQKEFPTIRYQWHCWPD